MSVGKIFRPALPLSNVAASNTATGQITPGRTIEGLLFKCGGTFDVQTHISLVRIKANGKTIIEGTGAQLSALAEFRGDTHSDSYLYVDFTESRKGRDFLDEMVGAWDTSMGVANITVEVTIGAATSPTLVLYTVESAPQAMNEASRPYAGLMHKILRYPWSIGAGGAQNIPLPFGPVNGAIIKRLHITHTNATQAVIKQDGVVVYDALLADAQQMNTQFKSVNQSGYMSIDFIPDGNVKNALDTRNARSLELQVTLSAADSGYVIAEYLDQLGNL